MHFLRMRDRVHLMTQANTHSQLTHVSVRQVLKTNEQQPANLTLHTNGAQNRSTESEE